MFFLLLFLLLLLLAIYVFKRHRHMSILKRNGILGPKPNFVYGNLFSDAKTPNVHRFSEYFAKYGKVMGFYLGKKPTVLVNDIELIRRIQIKDFHNFCDRQNFGIKHGLRPNPKFSLNLLSATGNEWKKQRSLLSPTFSAMKLKLMTPIMSNAMNIMMSKIEKKAAKNEEFDIYEYFQLLTTDVIAKCALGIDTDVQNNPHDEFLMAAKQLFDRPRSPFALMFTCFPELDKLLYPVRRAIELIKELRGKSINLTLSRLIHTAIKLRLKMSTQKKNDLLQLMLDAKMSEEDIKNTSVANLTADMDDEVGSLAHDQPLVSGRSNVKALSADVVVSTAIIFYQAGFETTSTALAFIAHVLVNDADIQEKVRQEVVKLHKEEGKFNYNTVNKLTFMNQVINETLRYYPPVTAFVTRTVKEDYHYKDIILPKDATVIIPTYQLHHSEELWPQHDQFNPERFNSKAHIDPVAFQPFGTGPRNCIGMRFALYEIKLALAELLFKYQLVPGPSTEKDLTIQYKNIIETPKNGVFVKVVPV